MSGVASAYLFNQGDIATVSFSSLPEIGSTTYSNDTRITFPPPTYIYHIDGSVEVDSFIMPGGSFRLDVYENRTDTVSTSSLIIGDPSTSSGIIFPPIPLLTFDESGNLINVKYATLWSDLEGKFDLTLLTGSISLDSLNVQVTSEGQVYGQSFDITSTTPTPIPAAAWLLGSGLVGLAGSRARRKE
jgi:hypothetical protein